jgi:acetyl esterase/lipase
MGIDRATVRIGVAIVALAAMGCISLPRKPDAFYDPPVPLPDGRPGDVLRLEPVKDGPDGARSFRVLYRSVGTKGEPVAVSAMLVVPDGPAPQGGRPVVTWAHPTTGVVRDCAPSLQPDWRKTIAGLDAMVEKGFVVVATDYVGLGTPGAHPYLVGQSEAQAVLDSVRAARNVKEAGAGDRFAVWGHSQGGHAALFTGQYAPTLAPELTLVGVAAAAPATDLATLLELDLDSRLGKVLASEALWSWQRVFDAPMSQVLVPGALPTVEKLAQKCVRDAREGGVALYEAMPLKDGFLVGKLAAREPWGAIMRENTPGASPIAVPVFISQGTADEVVRPQVTAAYGGRLCAQGTPVRFQSVQDGEHIRVAFQTAKDAVAWMADRFEGKPPPDECVRGK